MFEEIIVTKLKEQYKRRYAITLAPTTENIVRALQFADFAIRNKLSLYRALVQKFGFRYRRMEHFVTELGLWKPRPISKWSAVETEFRIFTWYIGEREEITIELVYHLFVPYPIIYSTKDLDERIAADMLLTAMTQTGWWVPLYQIKLGVELLERVDTWNWADTSVVNALLFVYKTKKGVLGEIRKRYVYANKLLITNFLLCSPIAPREYAFLGPWKRIEKGEEREEGEEDVQY